MSVDKGIQKIGNDVGLLPYANLVFPFAAEESGDKMMDHCKKQSDCLYAGLFGLLALYNAILTAFYLLFIVSLTMGSQMLEALSGKRVFRFYTNVVHPTDAKQLGDFLLFPGTTSIFSLLYICAVSAVILVSGVTLLKSSVAPQEVQQERVPVNSSSSNTRAGCSCWKHRSCGVGFVMRVVPALILVMHICGNVHYQFYCVTGMIPSHGPYADNCSVAMNAYTALSSISGAILISSFSAVVYYAIKAFQAVSNKLAALIEH